MDVFEQVDELNAQQPAVPDAANVEDQAATDEVAAPETETAPDTEVEDTEDESADEGSDEDSESADEPEVADAEESESFDDLLEDIPSDESILKTHARVPNAAKDDLIKYANGYRETKATLDKIGGASGVEFLEPLAAIIAKPTIPTQQESAEVFEKLSAGNQLNTATVMMDAMGFLLTAEAPQYANQVLESVLGEGMNIDHIRELKRLEDDGYDFKELITQLNSDGENSTLFASQQEKLDEAHNKIAELTELIKNPEKLTAQTSQQTNAVKDLDDELTTRITQGITPFRERGRWAEESALTKLALKGIMAELKDTGAYKAAVDFVRQNGTLKAGDTIPFPIEQQLLTLVGKAKGRFGEDVMAVNKELRKMQETSVNAKVKEEVKEATKPKAVEVEPDKANIASEMGYPPELQAIWDARRARQTANA